MTVRRLLCPELYWVLVYSAMYTLARTNVPPTEAGSQALEKWWFVLPFAAVPLTFGAFLLPWLRTRPWLLLLRVDAAAFIGNVFASYCVSSAIDYQDSRNAGVPMGWMMSVMFGAMVQSAASIAAATFIAWRQRARRMAGPPELPPSPD